MVGSYWWNADDTEPPGGGPIPSRACSSLAVNFGSDIWREDLIPIPYQAEEQSSTPLMARSGGFFNLG